MTKESLIFKAKHERGLTDEEIRFFLDRYSRWELLPYYACFLKKGGRNPQFALDEVVRLFGTDGPSSIPT